MIYEPETPSLTARIFSTHEIFDISACISFVSSVCNSRRTRTVEKFVSEGGCPAGPSLERDDLLPSNGSYQQQWPNTNVPERRFWRSIVVRTSELLGVQLRTAQRGSSHGKWP